MRMSSPSVQLVRIVQGSATFSGGEKEMPRAGRALEWCATNWRKWCQLSTGGIGSSPPCCGGVSESRRTRCHRPVEIGLNRSYVASTTRRAERVWRSMLVASAMHRVWTYPMAAFRVASAEGLALSFEESGENL